MLSVFSLIPHKELRFISPVIPLLNIYAGLYVESASDASISLKTNRHLSLSYLITPRRSRALLTLLLVTNAPVMIYTGLFHQRGVLDVTSRLHDLATSGSSAASVSVLVLAPCHTTPLYSHVHADVPVRILTCEPNLTSAPDYKDEADIFYDDPTRWLDEEWEVLEQNAGYPTHLVMYEKLWSNLTAWFKRKGYRRCAKLFNTHFPISSRQSSYLLLLCRV